MKYIIASDIHGMSAPFFKLAKRFRAENGERLILLGDILYHGPRNGVPEGYDPQGVIGLFAEMKNEILCVRGNCDTEVDETVLGYPIMPEYAVLENGKSIIFLTHGHKYNPSHMPPLKAHDILLFGHTHIPYAETINGITAINPGSLSLPKSGSEKSYMVFENGIFEWKTLDGATYKVFNTKEIAE